MTATSNSYQWQLPATATSDSTSDSHQRQLPATATGDSYQQQLPATATSDSYQRQLLAALTSSGQCRYSVASKRSRCRLARRPPTERALWETVDDGWTSSQLRDLVAGSWLLADCVQSDGFRREAANTGTGKNTWDDIVPLIYFHCYDGFSVMRTVVFTWLSACALSVNSIHSVRQFYPLSVNSVHLFWCCVVKKSIEYGNCDNVFIIMFVNVHRWLVLVIVIHGCLLTCSFAYFCVM